MAIAGGNSDYTAANPISATAIANAAADTQTLLIWNAGTAVAKSGTQSYNIGCWDSLTDRALGTDPTGTGAQVIQLAMTNNTGGTLYGVTFSYDCKCLTNGSAGTEETELPGYCFFYSTTGTSAANWTEVGYAGTINDTGGIPAAHGLCLPNYTQGTTMSSGPVTILFVTPLTNNGVMYFRWADDNNIASSPDQMLAIDNISIATYTPTGPSVSITSPANNASFIPGSSVAIAASASETGGTVTNVAFYSGSTKLGNVASTPYNYTWSSVPAGSYALTAVAADSSGITATSSVVNITVAHLAPTVAITSPAGGAAYTAPASIAIAATASDTDGNVTNVAVYSGATLLANIASAPYNYTWANVSAGSYSLTAVASVDTGASATSSAISVAVTNPVVASFTGSYSENFDLDLSNSTTIMPAGFSSLYLPGSHFTYTNAPGLLLDSNAIATATVGSGAATLVVWNVGSAVTDKSYQLFNIGCWDSLNDRALGTDPTGTAGTVIQLALTNNSGAPLSGVVFSYTEKCMTNGATSNGSYTDDGTERLELPGYEFFYSLTGDTNATNWFEVNALCLTNWVEGTSSDSGPVTITFPTPLAANGIMYFRWADDNCVSSSPDQMYAIDNIGITGISATGPSASITSPANGANFLPGSNIGITANASEVDGSITNVEFYANGTDLGGSTMAPYGLTWSSVPAGSYALTAVASDTVGLTATSSVVNVTVGYVPPTVSLISPTNSEDFVPGSGTPIILTANAADNSGSTITSVSFYAGSSLIYSVSSAPYTFTVPASYVGTTMPVGSYALTAVATDALGLMSTSSVVNITVAYPPATVSLTGPANNASFAAPASIPLSATVTDSYGAVTNVAFYQGSTLLANVTTAPYTYTWANVPAGSYTLTAQATDNNGVTGISSAVNVTVGSSLVASFTGSYTENFDEMGTNGTTAPSGWGTMYMTGSHDTFSYWTPDGGYVTNYPSMTPPAGSTLSPLTNVVTPGAATTQKSSGAYNFATTASDTDRALGTSPTGIAGTILQLTLANQAGNNLSGINISYDIRRFTTTTDNNDDYDSGLWDGVEEFPGYWLFYSLDNGNTWQNVSSLNPALAGPSGVIVPNSVGVTHVPATEVDFSTNWNTGNNLLLAWFDDNGQSPSPDQLLGLDNVTITGVNSTGPVVSFASPTNNENYIPGTGITIAINATDLGTNITSVGMYFEGTLEYTFTSAPYILPVPGGEVPPGSYSIYAVATDASGLVATSSVVNFTISYVPPTVSLTSPAAGASLPAYSSIPLSASAASADGTVTNVAFYQGATLLGNVTSAPFNYAWLNASAGSYNLTAQATDSHGLTATSSVVSITVTNGFGISLTSPANNANYLPDSSVPLAANAFESGGSITNVEFYANGADLGGVISAPYSLAWPNVSAGNYALTAVASDAAGNSTTSSVVNITVHVPPTISLTAPASGASYVAPASLTLSATASDSDGTITNVAFYQGSTLLANVASAPYTYTWADVSAGAYALTAVATDDSSSSSTSSVVNVTVTNAPVVVSAALSQVKTIFIIPLENHDLVQQNPTGSPQQLLGNPACPYFNSLITPGNSNAVQVSYATHYFSCAINGEHPSEPNYVWSEAGTDFGIRTDNDPTAGNNQWSNVQHLSGQLTTAGIAWKDYQEDVEYSSSEEASASGSGVPVNAYNGTTDYNYAVKHNPMAFFTDTQSKNCYPLTNFWADLTTGNIGRYNWITPDQYNEMHSSLPNGYTYNGTAWTGDQAAIAEGDNFLSIVIPKIMASQAYKDHGVIIIWTDETESTDDTNTTLPYVIISPLAKGNAYASTLPYSHSSDLKTMDEIFGLAFQTNAIPSAEIDAQNDGKYNYVDGRSAVINDLSDFFQTIPMITNQPASVTNLAGTTASFNVGATACSSLNYQWYFGTNLLAGQTNSTLNLASVGPTNAGYYDVIVSNAVGSTNSNPASLTVIYQAPNVVGGQMMLNSGGGFQLTFSGPSGQTYEVLASDDLTVPQSEWPVVSTGTFGGSSAVFTDPDATNHPHRYYIIKSP